MSTRQGRLHSNAIDWAKRLGFDTGPMHGHTVVTIRQSDRTAIRCTSCKIIVASVRADVIGLVTDWFEVALQSHALNAHPFENPENIRYEFGVIKE